MNTRAFHSRKLGATVLVRPLRNGDTDTVAAVFERLGAASPASRLHGPKPRLTAADLAVLAAVGGDRHVLVAYLEGDPRPLALARLVRDAHDARAAEIAFEVADGYQRRGIGAELVRMLLADARAAGIARVEAVVEGSNRPAFGLLRRVLERSRSRVGAGGEVRVSAPLVTDA